MSASQLRRPDDEYFVEPWSDTFLRGDLFVDVPIAIAAPPDAVVMAEGERRFVSGPFDAGPAMLLSPSCAIAAQGQTAASGAYAHPVRIMVPLRSVTELLEAGAVTEQNLGNLRSDRLRNYLYLPEGPAGPESVALLYMPISIHHDVIAESRVAQLTGAAYWHLRVKLMAFIGGVVVDPEELGEAPEPRARVNWERAASG